MRSRQILQRRLFLKAVGLGLAVPLSLKIARLAVAAPAGRPKRLLILYVPHGAPIEHFMPAGRGSSFDLAAGPGENILAPFAPYQNQFVLLGGVKYPGRDHPMAMSMLKDSGRSIEETIRAGIGGQSIVLGAVPTNDSSGTTLDNPVFPTLEPNPVKVYDKKLAYSSAVSGYRARAAIDDSAFRAEVTDLAIEEVSALHDELRSLTDEESKLAEHLASLRELRGHFGGGATTGAGGSSGSSGAGGSSGSSGSSGAGGAGGAGAGGAGGAGGSGGGPTGCGTEPASIAALRQASKGSSSFFFNANNFPAIFDAHLDICTYALTCGKAQVIGLQTMWANADVDFKFMGTNGSHHSHLSHNEPGTAQGRADFAKAQRFLLSRFEERVLRPLKAQVDPSDPTHSLLDNTLIYVCSEIADGQEHNCDIGPVYVGGKETRTTIPLMLIGGGGGALKGQQVFDFNNRPSADVLATIANLMGVAGVTGTVIPGVSA